MPPKPIPFPWTNHRRRLLVCPPVHRFTGPGFHAAIGPAMVEVELLLKDREPGGPRATRPLRNPEDFRAFLEDYLQLVPSLLRAIAMSTHDESTKTAVFCIEVWNRATTFFIDLAAAA